MDTTFSTPMMKQYLSIKSKYQDCLLLYRMGDFYELFIEDAAIGAQILNITLTHKRTGKDGKIPMAGIPYHAVDSYLHKLIKAGHKVAICEQLSPPNKRGLVERDVIRVVTPGTLLDERALEKKSHNYIISILCDNEKIGMSISDISTGYFATMEKHGLLKETFLQDELSRLKPSECILPEHLYNDPSLLKLLKQEENINIYCFQNWQHFAENSEQFLEGHFGIKTLAAFGIQKKYLALQSAAALLGYLQTTQKTSLKHIQKLTVYEEENALLLDRSTMTNLELFSTLREHEIRGTLLSVLDETLTSMGGRLLKDWIKKPLRDQEEISKRHDAVEELFHNNSKCREIREILQKITDIERVLSRLSVNIGNARDLSNLKTSLATILKIKSLVKTLHSPLFTQIDKSISKDVETVIAFIETALVDEPPIDIRSGSMIRTGINKDLDLLRSKIANSKKFIQILENNEREKTGITSLKVRFNQVFGFYIEVSKPNLHLIPADYTRKQTLVNGERFITDDLKHHEEIILTAEEKVNKLEYDLFLELLKKVLKHIGSLQTAANSIASLDCIANFAHISQKHAYVRPKILLSGEIRVTQSRHPVVERLLDNDKQFVPNDVCLDNINQSLLLVTGPNMAGKSVFIRQVALIVLLNQIGCFVPAKTAHLSLVDRIFVRSGANDAITSGLSTFMVEMVETAHILHNATSNSLIVMDEIGRGTSTYDGISIAWAIAKFLATSFKIAPKTLFATHYHELQALEKDHPNIKNVHMAVAEEKDTPIFLHTVQPGGASHSFGIAVAKLAGIPQDVIENAKNLLQELEQRNQQTRHSELVAESSHVADRMLKQVQHDNALLYRFIQKELENINIATLTPLSALNKLAELQEQLKILTSVQSSNQFKDISS